MMKKQHAIEIGGRVALAGLLLVGLTAFAIELNRKPDALLAMNGRYKQLYDKQYRFEKDQFINPGEDFTPEPEAVITRPAGRSSTAL